MVSAKVVLLTGISAVIGTNVAWCYVLKEPGLSLQQNPEYLAFGAIGGAVIGGVVGYVWESYE
jgi:hypothetical protein